MSIRQVTCPACQAVANVPAAMTNIKCPACGQVWNVNQPAAARPQSETQESDDGDDSNLNTILLAGGSSVLVILAIIGIGLALFAPERSPPPAPAPAKSTVTQTEPVAEQTPTFREVDLPESTRKKIYSDYRRMAKSSIEKKVMARKGSVARESVDNMLQAIVDREITHFALNHNISEDDVLQIVAEGDAKQWPGSKKKETPAAADK